MENLAETEKKQNVKKRIYKYLQEGMFKKDAAAMAGISEATYFRWIKEDESFESQVELRILKFKHTLVKNVILSSHKDGRLALEILRRRFPKEWGINGTTDDKPYHSTTDEVADLLQKILLSSDEEDE